MNLDETIFYKPLIWAIKKYFSTFKNKLPIGKQKIIDSCSQIDYDYRSNLDTLFLWSYSSEGDSYWEDLHYFLRNHYGTTRYFTLMLEDYKKNNDIQLNFDFYENKT